MGNLSDVKAGDEVIIHYDGIAGVTDARARASRVTSGCIHAHGAVFSRIDGKQLTSWSPFGAQPYIVAIIEAEKGEA
jgi:hypothetical protein